MFGINGAEFVVLLLIAAVVIGPERLPTYAEQLARWVRSMRASLTTTKERLAEELGEESSEVDWASLDPRRYDPRRIVREALAEPPSARDRAVGAGAGVGVAGADRSTGRGTASSTTYSAGVRQVDEPGPPPFDDEAT